MSYKCEVCVQGEWTANALRFATSDEAVAYGHELLSRWMVPTDSRAVECADAVNYTFTNGRAQPIKVDPT